MRLVLETGAGTPGANAYDTVAFVTEYLQARSRETEAGWISKAPELQQGAIIAGTDFIEKRWGPLFKGTPLRSVIIGRAASATLAVGVPPSNSQTFTLGQVTYRFASSLAAENDVLIGADEAETLRNLVAAINGGDGRDELYHDDTRTNFEAFAAIDEDDETILIATAYVAGENGNEIAFSSTLTGPTLSGPKLSGGLDTGAQPLSFPRCELYTPSGSPVIGVPLKLKQATAEYAVRALDFVLAVDPTVSSTGALVKRFREKVGPIEEETEYVDGAQPQQFRAYPAADNLLWEYVLTGGRTYR